MPLPVPAKTLMEKKLNAFLRQRIPPELAGEIRLSYKFRGNSVTIFEHRPPWHADDTEWSTMSIAQLRYNQKTGTWMLYWSDRNSRWHEDEGLAPVKTIDLLLAELDRDPTGIYWG